VWKDEKKERFMQHCFMCQNDSKFQTVLAFAEVSDQNFVDEEVEGEKESDMHADVKRIKSCTTNASSNDQVMCIIDFFYY
jgi:hypothetical protein